MNRIDNAESTTDLPKPHPLVFEVVLNETSNETTDGSCLEGHSAVVEIESLLKASAITSDPADVTRHEAEKLACRIALHASQKDLYLTELP